MQHILTLKNFIIKKNIIKMKIFYRTLMLISMFSILSCDKEEVSQSPMSQTDIWNCYNNSAWSELKINNELIGRWKWVYSENFWAPDKGRNTENENTLIEFLNDSTLKIIINGKLENTTNWIVSPKDEKLYGLELDSAITTLLLGRILICRKTLEFNNSYIDGSDNFFRKVE